MSDKVTVRFIAAPAMVMNLLGWCIPAHAQDQSSDAIKQAYDRRKQPYDVSKTVTIEAEVIGFAVNDANAQMTLNPVGEPNSRGAIQVNWHSSSSLSNQGITSDWLKPGDRVVVTGHPVRGAGNWVRLILLKTITRSSDGRKWADGASSTSTPPSTGASGAAPAPATPPPAAAVSGSPPGVSSESGSNTNSTAALSGFGGTWWSVKRSGHGSDVYLPGHVSEVSSLTIEIAGDVMSVRRTGVAGETEGTTYVTSTYRIDGGEHPFSFTRPNHGTTTGTVVGKRDGNRIVLDIKLQYGPRGARTAAAKRVFSLTPDGSLVIETRGEHFVSGVRQDEIGGTWVFNRPSTGSSGSGHTPPAPAARPTTTAPPVSKPPPEQTETLAERQAKINQDVTAKTNAIVADLKKKSDAELAQAAAPSQAASQAAAQLPGAQGQSPGASAGPAWKPCAGDLRSGASQTVVPVEFVNSSTQSRKLYWFDFAGAKVLVGTLQPGQRAPMQTYTTHAWLITDESDNCLGTLVISKPGAIEIR